MKKRILIIIIISTTQIYAQKNFAVGINFGLGKNFYKNYFETDGNHFKFNNPTSVLFGAQIIKNYNEKNQIVSKFEYINKKISFEYNSNEPKIPYKVNDKNILKFDVLSLAIGLRRKFNIKKVNAFFEVDLVADYNLHVSIATSGTGSGDPESDTPLTEPILFSGNSNSNLGEKSYRFGNNLSFGFNFGKKKQFELSSNVNIPYGNIQKSNSHYNYKLKYQDIEYKHQLTYKGKIIYPSIKFVTYVFKK